MPRYFFHTTDGSRVRDAEGVMLDDRASARMEAIKFAGVELGHHPDHLWDGRDFRVEVTDEDGRLVVTIVMLAVEAPAMSGF